MIQPGSAVLYHDDAEGENYSGVVLETKEQTIAPASVPEQVALVKWDDGYDQSWIRFARLEELA